MRQYVPKPPCPAPTDVKPSPRFQPFLSRTLGVLLAYTALTAGHNLIEQTADRHKGELAQKEAKENAARTAWADAAKKISTVDRRSLARFARVSGGSLPPQFRAEPNAQTPAQIVDRNQPALDALRAALYLPYRPEAEQSTSRLRGVYVGTNFQPLSHLLIAEGRVKQSRGDVPDAANTYVDLIQMGQTLRRGGALGALLSSSAFDRMGRSALWKLLPSLDAQTARGIARRLETQGASDDGWYENALREEELLGNAALVSAFDNPKKLQQLQRNARLSAMISAMLQARSGTMGAYNYGMIYAATNATTVPTPLPTLYNRGMQKCDEWKARQSFSATLTGYRLDAHQPFQMWRLRSLRAQAAAASAAAQGGTPRAASTWFPAPQPQSFYEVFTSYGSSGMVEFAQSQITETQTGSRLLRVACALVAYRQEHNGHDPNALSELVPAYLSRIPDDPYSFPVAPLAYKSPAQNASPNNTRGTLYSVGPDGVNDGGVAPQGSIRRFGMGWYYYGGGGAFSQSIGSGDLVAGKNAP